MNLVEIVRNKVAEFDRTGDKQAAVEYFKAFVPTITRPKLSAWIKSGKLTVEMATMADGVVQQEFEETPPLAPQGQPPRRPAPAPPPEEWNGQPQAEEPPPSSEFIEPETETTLPPHQFPQPRVTTTDGRPLPPEAASRLPVYGQPASRTPDIRRLERSTPIVDQDYDPVLEGQIIGILLKLGFKIPAQSRPPPPTAPLLGANPKMKFRQRSWNEPPGRQPA
jgi:hypothetical protein